MNMNMNRRQKIQVWCYEEKNKVDNLHEATVMCVYPFIKTHFLYVSTWCISLCVNDTFFTY